jgi:hypothetical protein
MAIAALAAAGESKLLWEIGKADNDTREFALAPGGYAKFKDDGFFVVGQSDPKRDWPYVQPGPTDAWAGSRSHEFRILFALKAAPKEGQCRLLFDLVDTHGGGPPTLAIDINGKKFPHALPRGGGDKSVSGEPAVGKEHKFDIPFPANLLHEGTNEIAIATTAGSWFLYDWLGLEAPGGLELGTAEGTIVHSIRSAPALILKEGKPWQTLRMAVLHMGKEAEAVVKVASFEPVKLQLRPGSHAIDVPVPAIEKETAVAITVEVGGKVIAKREETLKPVRKWVVYILPHSHVDIGYTRVQTEVERDHWRFYEQAIAASRKTADYPKGAQFKWNVEVLWATDSYLKQATPEKRAEFIEAVKAGWVGLQALYGNELTALCRPEELVRLTDCARRLARQCGVTIDSAMISDVPGYTWGMVPVLAQSGVKYFSIGPNGGDRIGYTLEAWADKPFWWVSPSGRERVLCWIPTRGYWRGFQGGDELLAYLQRLEAADYPYELAQIRHCLGDNAGPGVDLCEFAKDWNTKYAYPKIVIATPSEMFQDFERRYADKVPVVRGDFTPYWEDGAASSARETALNRAAAERLSQAEALFAMFGPNAYPADDFYAAWRNAILYDEHTWGAHNSISQPDSDFAKAQWAIKQRFALDADEQSRKLFDAATAKAAAKQGAALDVLNTASWPRTDLVLLSKEQSAAGDLVRDAEGNPVPSQRLSTGELAFLAKDVPPFGAKRYTVSAGAAHRAGTAMAPGVTLSTSTMGLTIDAKTGAIATLQCGGIQQDLVNAESGLGLNDYFYVAGKDPKAAKRGGPAAIKAKEHGPLVASLVIESEAPGCRKLTREVRLVEGLDRVDIMDVLDKDKIRTKEGVHIAFAFNVAKGVVRMDIPWAVARPEDDQINGACKNWFTVQRWVDVSNDAYGVTWATVDAPLVEVGAITAETPWIKTLAPSQTLYSYVMNNYWHTNYRDSQEGPTVFRYALKPHAGGFDGAAAARFGIECSQPLIPIPVAPDAPARPSLLRVEPAGVIVATLKPSEDRKAIIVRLFGASGKAEKATLTWGEPAPKGVWLSNLAEDPLEKATGPADVPAWGLVTLRAELP